MKGFLLAVCLAGFAQAQTNIAIVISPNATGVEKLAADELSSHLKLLYPHAAFPVATRRSGDGPAVLVGTPASLPELGRYFKNGEARTAESFVVTRNGSGAVVAGADPRGALFGVYALLEKLGFGFYLSYNAHPPARSGPVSFESWELADRPLVSTRLVFNWHNFLSGCSTWDLEDWQNWILQSSRMRFNTIMVHAYGNNPIVRFTHNGLTKPTGYLSTTARGRDWGTEHVLDVRRLIGAEGLFDGPIFGAAAGLAPEEQTSPAATALMQKVFQFAAGHGMGVTFALDVDTASSNPQNIISTLPPSARFATQGSQLVNPETPEGYAYYRSEIEQLLRTYPQITQLAVWFRGERNSLWRGLNPEDFPPGWREQYERAIRARADLRANIHSPSMFAIGKIAAAFRKILDETGHRDVTLGAGSWRFDFLAPADAFMPPGLALLPLDYSYQFPSDPVQEAIRPVNRNRPVIPIVWAHHDDRSYAGRPYMPFPGFASMLRASGSPGYGIIHWTTRPLDLYFKSLAGQVWSASENELLNTTCARMAERTFGAAARDAAQKYLLAWIQDAPMFGRETTDRFIDQHLAEGPVLEGSRQRVELLKAVKPLARSGEGSVWVQYFEDWERFVQAFYRTHAALEQARAASDRGDLEQARRQLTDARPEAAIEQYARTIAHGKADRGEKGILIAMNLKWLPYFAAERQSLGMEPLRIRFAPTAPEALAQSPGKYTYAFDSNRRLWLVLGAGETASDVAPGADRSPCAGGLKVDREVALTLPGISVKPLPAGNPKVTLELPRGAQVETSGAAIAGGKLTLTLKPVNGTASVCGLVVEMSGRAEQATGN